MDKLQNYQYIAGVDEVGRGPLAGPVVAAAVVLDPTRPIAGLMDSKVLSEKKREYLAAEIKNNSICWAIGRAEVQEIDDINILQASLLAMKRAVLQLKPAAEFAQVDGNRCPDLPCPSQAIIKGDASVECISAASIIAKVARDNEMKDYDTIYPGYGLAKHKGYPTKQHIAAINELGITEIHRLSFGPVKKVVENAK
ncbi:Ribonuclease HII [hydrothermal vent metagenome]|uniref:Ribonuclease HII n=1 Tax=hydrothermal vent metagenome TaxID=652676 RepID=A0A3B0ZIU5_9ZZZZ